MIAGCRLLELPYRVIGVCVCDDRPTFQRRVAALLAAFAERYQLDVALEPEGIEVWDDYVGAGYAISRPEELRLIHEVARLEGLLVDPVYSGKAMFGLASQLAMRGAGRTSQSDSDPARTSIREDRKEDAPHPLESGLLSVDQSCQAHLVRPLSEPVVFLHSGGIFGLFAKSAQITDVLEAQEPA